MKKKAKLIGYILGTLVFISTIAGFTYAMYRKSLYNVNISGELKNLNEYVIYSKGVNISSGTLMPVDSYTEGNSATITFYKNSNTPYDIYGHIYLDINSLSAVPSRELKYTIVDNSSSNVISEGSFYTYTTGSSLLAAANIPLNTSETTYTVYVWVDEALYDINTANGDISIDIRCYATMKEIANNNSISVPNNNTAVNYIKYMYDSRDKKTATVNNITYNLAPSLGLMNDRHASMSTDINGGNIRYYGANPNNYVWLGDTYTTSYTFAYNGSNITRNVGDKKLWRIIGVFDGRLKLVSNDPISAIGLSWDTSANNTTGGNSGNGINQWGPSPADGSGYKGADLMKLLNPGYEDNQDLDSNGDTITVNNSLYWNKGTGTVYTGQSNATTANVSFADTGLTAAEKGMIDTAVWYLGTYNGNPPYVNIQYNAERQNNNQGKICSSGNNCNDLVTRTSSWEGKVGLIYPSDHGYAVDLSKCNKGLLYYNDSSCKTSSWLRNSSKNQYTINARPYSGDASRVNSVGLYSSISTGPAASNIGYTRSAVYLKPGVTISSGNGSQSNPYVLSY